MLIINRNDTTNSSWLPGDFKEPYIFILYSSYAGCCACGNINNVILSAGEKDTTFH